MIGLSFKSILGVILMASASCTAFAAGPGFPRTEKSFNQLDGDKDGKLSVAEIEPRSEKYLFRLDQNADGSLTKEEIEAWLQKGLQRRRDLMLADYDADRDGAISRQELSTFVSAEFGKADKDGDGSISLEESRTYHYVRAGTTKPAEQDDDAE
jgi:Ca2+-binding EF-hand superfamily protein